MSTPTVTQALPQPLSATMSLPSHTKALISSLAPVNLSPGSIELIPSNFEPTTELHVSFGNKAVTLGNLLRASECKSEPNISFSAEVGPRLKPLQE